MKWNAPTVTSDSRCSRYLRWSGLHGFGVYVGGAVIGITSMMFPRLRRFVEGQIWYWSLQPCQRYLVHATVELDSRQRRYKGME